MFKLNKSNLDEMKEQELLKIESKGCWIAFWGLFIAYTIENFFFDDPKIGMGELIVFIILALYLSITCIRHGIWDRRLKPNTTTNLVICLIASLFCGLYMFLSVLKRYPDKIFGSLAAGLLCTIFLFALLFAVLSLSAAAYKKKNDELNNEATDEND